MPASGFGEVAERLRRSTARVEAGGRGNGSGVVWSASGLVVTNAHVATGTSAVVELWDGRRFQASVKARDTRRDLAALEIPASGLPSAESRATSTLRVGEVAIAVGNPLGFTGALSTGIIHAVGPLRGLGRQNWVQADVRLAPGNSGGPLADAAGRVIGINTMIVSGGLGLAVPSDAVAQLLRSGGRPFLGVTLQPVPLRQGASPATGLLVLSVNPGSPAAQSSLRAGDLLIAAGGREFSGPDDLAEALESAGETLILRFLRGDRSATRETTVRLEARAVEAA